MAFLSSKLVRQVENIFKLTLQPDSVRAGQIELIKLREKPYFQLALANFLSRSNNHNHRIFAALQLQKKVVLRDVQTVVIIKETYFRDIDKIADIVRKIMLHDDNFGWAGQFLTFNFDQMGMMELVRYTRLLFGWLSAKDKALRLVDQYFDDLIKSFSALADIAAESADSFFMVMVTVSMFLEAAFLVNRQPFSCRIDQLWMIYDQKCKFYGTQSIDLIKIAIQKFLYHRGSSDYPQNCLFDLITSLLNYQWAQNQLKLLFQSQCLELILKHGAIFGDIRGITEFITAFSFAAHRANQSTLSQSSFKTLSQINNKVELELLGKEQERVRTQLCGAIEQIFEQHYQLVSQQYRQQSKDCKSLFLYLLPLVNYYNSTRSQAVRSWVNDHLESAVNHVGDLLSSLRFQQFVEVELRSECVGCLQLLVRYKLLVPVKMMPHIVCMLQEISAHDSELSSLCYLFMDQVWEELALLDFTELADFILKHLRQLNANEWDHCLQSFSCFLNLAQHLEQHYQFYSHLIITDDLVLQSIRAHEIMVGLIMETPRGKLNFDLINKLLLFTSYLLAGLPQDHYSSFHQGLRVSYLARFIQEHVLHSLESARILAFDYVVTGKVVPLRTQDGPFWGLNGDENNSEFEDQISDQVQRFKKPRK